MNHTNNTFKQLAIIGATASGKTALSIQIAQAMNAYILSLDSLAIYKDIDIVSAKPTKEEQAGIEHFGLDLLYPDETFDVNTFIALYQQVYTQCLKENKNLVIVGGTSFYLKMLIDGISDVPAMSKETRIKTAQSLLDSKEAYAMLHALDSLYMSKIASNDTYRIEKALNIYFETSLTPTAYFSAYPPKAIITHDLPIYQIVWDKTLLRERIALRTNMMLEEGLIDEICALEQKYGRAPNCMKSIGIKETLAYLDGIYNKTMLIEKITTNTARLAKRQNTFNRSQFKDVISGSVEKLANMILLH